MISSIDLFFRRDCADGAGPVVELPSPILVASPEVAAVVPAAAVGAGADAVGCALVDAGVELVVLLLLPRVGKNEEPEVAVDVLVPLGAVVEAAVVGAVEEAGVFPPSLGKLKPVELPPVAALDDVGAEENRFLGASELAAAGLSPPRFRVLEGVVLGCDAAGVPPRLKVGGLLAGVADGVVLPRLPNKDDFCPPD